MVGYESEPINGRELSSVEHSEAGLVSGIATRMIIQPLDVLKIRFQLQEEPIGGANSGKYKSVTQSVRLILKEESVAAFWKGHIPAQGLSAVYGLVQFASFERLTRQVYLITPNFCHVLSFFGFQSPIDFACGSIAGCLAMTAAMPLDVIRTRLVAQGHQSVVYKGTLDALPHIWRTEGFKGYFRGWVPGLIQVAPFTGLQFTMYNAFYKLWNKLIKDHENYGALVAGAASGTVAKTVLYPLDMVRHRLQVNGFKRSGFGKQTQHDRRMIRSMLFILKTESIYGLFKGLLPSLLVSTQALCMTASKLIFGVASDKVSPAFLLCFGLCGTSLAVFSLSYATSLTHLLCSSALLGGLQGAAWVPATKLVSNWFKDGSFATFFSLLGCGSNMAGLLLPTISFFYWRTYTFYLGVACFLFTIFVYLCIEEKDSGEVDKKKEKPPGGVFSLFSSKVLWGIAIPYLIVLEIRTATESWMPLFIKDVEGDPGRFMFLYETGGIIGTFVSGLMLDILCKYVELLTARRILAFLFGCLMIATIAISTSLPNYIIPIGFSLGFFLFSALNVWCMISSQAGLKSNAGSFSAFVSFIANFGSVFAGAPLAHLVSLYGYNCFAPFFLMQLCALLVVAYMNIPHKMAYIKKID
ncbi:unnamed protein product [Auanema sp. JU1783]|nr:unnamed protein product [Auanema sp. JU1783]